MSEPSPSQNPPGVLIGAARRPTARDWRQASQPGTESDLHARLDPTAHRDEIVALIVHELRSPLAAMANVLEGCRAAPSSLALVKTRDLLDRQLHIALHLVDDLLDISRLNAAVPEMDDAVDLSRVITDAVEDLGHQFRVQCQVLAVHLPTGAVLVRGHAIRLRQVVANLLDNSNKYSPVGGQITLRLACEADQAVLRIQDNGLGITAEDLPHVFDPFFRSKHSLNRPQGGLGIGLALARRLVELHNGTIDASSDGPNRGSEFTVRLPAAPVRATSGAWGPEEA